MPYHPLVEALRASPHWPALTAGLPPVWREELARLLPELDGRQGPVLATNEGRVQEALFQGLLAATEGAARRVLVVDDLHWADRATLALLAYLIRRTRQSHAPLLLVATTRPFQPGSELGQLTQTLIREGRMLRIRLGPLERNEVEALSRHLSPAFSYPLAAWLQTQSEGNPFVIAELIAELRDQRILQGASLNPAALPAAPTVPPGVYGLILNRLAPLSEAARRLLEAAVIIGREFEFEVAQRASALGEREALDALDELQRARLVAAFGAPGACRVDHALTAEVVRREMSDPRHRHLHRRTAAALEHLGRATDDAHAAVIATHLHDAGEVERAAPYAVRAADRAGRVAAWREAVIFFEWAVAGTRDRERKAGLLRRLGQARLEAGQATQAEQAFQEALTLTSVDNQRALIQLELAQSLLQQSRFGDAVHLAQALLEQPTPDTLTRATAELLWGTALSVEGSDLHSADHHLARAEALINRTDQSRPEMCAQVRFERGSVAAQQGDLQRALAHYRESLAVADEATQPVWATLAHNNIAYHALLSGDIETAQTHVAAGLRLSDARGLLSLRAYLLSTKAEIALHLGQFETAEALLADGLAIAEQLGMRERIAGLTANLGLVAARRHQPALAIHRLSTALAQADAIGTLHLAAQIRIWLAPLLPPAERRARLDEARAIATSGGRSRLLDQLNRLTNTD